MGLSFPDYYVDRNVILIPRSLCFSKKLHIFRRGNFNSLIFFPPKKLYIFSRRGKLIILINRN